MMSLRWSTVLSFLVVIFIIPDTFGLSYGEQCDATPVYSPTWEYNDSCQNIYLYCDPATNTCKYKGCSNADYIKGWDVNLRPLPARCNKSTFCPDDSSTCKPLVPLGSFCEPQRDDECQGQNAICLNSTCFAKVAPLGGNCGTDTTQYVSYDAEGNAVEQVIIRDNCTTGTYCDSNYKCITSKPIGQTCQQDRECLSGTCSNSGVCVNGPDVFHTIPAWLWAVVGVAVFLFVLLILGLLWVLHRYQSKKEREKIEKFFGDNEEFAKYAMLEHDELQDGTIAPLRKRTDSRTSMVFLATPDYNESAALGTTRPLSWRHNSSTTKLRSSYSPSPHTSTLDLPRSSTPDLNRLSNSEQPR